MDEIVKQVQERSKGLIGKWKELKYPLLEQYAYQGTPSSKAEVARQIERNDWYNKGVKDALQLVETSLKAYFEEQRIGFEIGSPASNDPDRLEKVGCAIGVEEWRDYFRTGYKNANHLIQEKIFGDADKDIKKWDD